MGQSAQEFERRPWRAQEQPLAFLKGRHLDRHSAHHWPAERGAYRHTAKTRLAAYRRPMVRASCSWSWCFHASSQLRRAIISAIVRYLHGDPRLLDDVCQQMQLAAGTGNRCQHDGYLRPRCYGYSFCKSHGVGKRCHYEGRRRLRRMTNSSSTTAAKGVNAMQGVATDGNTTGRWPSRLARSYDATAEIVRVQPGAQPVVTLNKTWLDESTMSPYKQMTTIVLGRILVPIGNDILEEHSPPKSEEPVESVFRLNRPRGLDQFTLNVKKVAASRCRPLLDRRPRQRSRRPHRP